MKCYKCGNDKDTFDKELLVLYRAGQDNPLGAETKSEVYKIVCDFIEDLFNI